MAWLERGILCSRLFFIRAPGMVQVKSSQLISSQVAIRASMLRTPVKAVKIRQYRTAHQASASRILCQGAAELVLWESSVMAAEWLFPKFLDCSRRYRIADAVLPVDSPYHDGREVAAYLAGQIWASSAKWGRGCRSRLSASLPRSVWN